MESWLQNTLKFGKVLFLFGVLFGRWVSSGNPFAGRLNHYHDIGIFDTMRACNANSTVP